MEEPQGNGPQLESNVVQEKQSFLRKVPGFRSNTWWKKLIAVPGYTFLILILIGLLIPSGQDSNSTGESLKSTVTTNGPSPLEVSKENYTKGIAAFNSKDWEAAEAALKNVISEDPNYTDAQSKLKEVENVKALNLLASAKLKATNKDYDGSISDLNKAIQYNRNLVEAIQLLPQVEKQKEIYLEQLEKQKITEYKASCKTYAFRVLNKNPDSFAGERIKLRGQILQIQEDSTGTFMLVQMTYQGYDIWSDNVAVFYFDQVGVYEQDVITIWGEVIGAFSYKSRAGWDLTVPSIKAKYIE